ncbi:helix-turn-helix domain-containing protein [Nocardia sp. NPDC059239]|uniref:helix-turn-helix domain-containing protein n=1 Tax=unclassified Nocardia TaxID=2637762 RepID=UPI0036B3DE82
MDLMHADESTSLTDIDAVVGAQLRHQRDKRRMTRAEVAALSGLSPVTIQRLEGGSRSADVQQLAALAGVYGLTLHGFMTMALKGTAFSNQAKSE